MANPNKVMGQARIKANGRIYDTEGKSTLEPGGVVRTPQEADFRGGMYSEATGDSRLECNVLVTGDVSLTELQAIEDATVTMEADTGQTWVISHAYVAEKVSLSEGKAKVIFMGPPAEELVQ